MTTTIEQRLDRIESHLAIEQGLYRYSLALDNRDYDLLREVFAEECVFDYGAAGMGRLNSLAEFVAACRKVFDALDTTLHNPTAPIIEIDGDSAKSQCTGVNQHVNMAMLPHHHMLMAGRYEDQWRRVDGRWRIYHRTTFGSWAAGNPAVVGQVSIRGATIPK